MKLSKQQAIALLDKNNKFTGHRSIRGKTWDTEYYWCRTWSDYIWCIINDIDEAPVCISCNKPTKRYGWSAFRPFCSPKCAQTNQETINKTNKTNMATFGVKRPCQNINVMIKKNQTCMRKYGVHNSFLVEDFMGPITPEDILPDFEVYKKRVWETTNYEHLSSLVNYDLRGIMHGWSLDHKYSCAKGFSEGILPYYIGRLHNLEMLTISENSSKNKKCSITKEELFFNLPKPLMG